jgi:hypothetical protein
MNRATSPKQIAANRRNALKSTGPRTRQGRAVSRMNALKHGILSKEVLVRGRVLQECEAELAALHRRFQDDLQPQGPLEEMLVDQIVTAHWRLRRALTAEAGEIALSVDSGEKQRTRGTHPALQWMKWTEFGDPILAMGSSRLGNRILKKWLSEVRSAVEQDGELTESTVQKLAQRFDGKVNSLVAELEAFRTKAAEERSTPVSRKKAALTFLDRKLRGIELLLEICDEEENREEETRQAAAVLPSGATLDKILRYETKLERQIYRALAQLERMQRMRRGEAVPPPLTVDLQDRA